MPLLQSDHLGSIEYAPGDVIEFPQGLPAFENERQFLALDVPGKAPLVFLQSLVSPGLTFITLPAGCIDPEYRVDLPEDCGGVVFVQDRLMILVIVSIGEQCRVTANLLAPVLIDTAARKAAQVVMAGSRYSVQHPLESVPWGAAPACS